MSTSAPIPLIQNGLVFCYDTSNIKSYRGQPTTNVAVNPLDLYAWGSAAGVNGATLARDSSIPLSPVNGIPLKMTTTAGDAYIATYSSASWNLSPAAAGQTWTISVWVKANRNISNTTCELFIFEANSSGSAITWSSGGFYATSEWTRVSFSRTLTDATTAYVQVRLDGPNAYTAGDIVWWDGLQVEQKSYATQFVNGTRSNTNGLIDLTNNNTINLSAAGFDSGANLTFNGSSNWITVPNTTTLNIGTGGHTESVWVKLNSTANQRITIKRFGSYGYGYSLYVSSSIFGYEILTPSTYIIMNGPAVITGTWYHVVVSIDRSLTSKMYVNGVLVATADYSSFTGLDITNTYPLTIGAVDPNISPGAYLNGTLSTVMLYNRALSQSEALQIYNSTKSRFGL